MNIGDQKHPNRIIFITGGARSGKSSFALREAEKIEGRKLYIATAEPLDDEMKERIRRHREKRSSTWDTLEEPIHIYDVLKTNIDHYNIILVDCLTLWLSNLILRNENSPPSALDPVITEGEQKRRTDGQSTVRDESGEKNVTQKVGREIDSFLRGLGELKRSRFNLPLSVLLVSNEVGMGIVPENRIARLFRDMAGELNQRVAKIADAVYLSVSGITLKIKG